MTFAGIYIHFPFCRSRCSYCDFATGTYDRERADRYVSALVREIERWLEIETPEPIDTIYLGGGTPSLLTSQQLKQILTTLKRHFDVAVDAEITIEINPGLVGRARTEISSQRVLSEFREAGINRASFGIQTFNDKELARLGRSHSAQDARDTFRQLRVAGFENISFDLIAGLPGQTIDGWHQNLEESFVLEPEHLSFYLLEVHERTPLADHIRRGLQPRPDDELAARMYQTMLEQAAAAGYEHYEISNLCKSGFESRHNIKYWTGAPYYGFGCSSHSYDGRLRRWSNERDLARYTELVESGRSVITERVELSEREALAESIFLGLRLMSGINIQSIQQQFNVDIRDEHSDDLNRFREAGLLKFEGHNVRLTQRGALLSNEVFTAFI